MVRKIISHPLTLLYVFFIVAGMVIPIWHLSAPWTPNTFDTYRLVWGCHAISCIGVCLLLRDATSAHPMSLSQAAQRTLTKIYPLCLFVVSTELVFALEVFKVWRDKE